MFTNNLKRLTAFCLASLAIFSLNNLHAAKSYHAHDDIRQTAKAFALQLAEIHAANADIDIKVGKLDSRLKLKQCSQQLEAFESPNSKSKGNTTVGVRCNDHKGWKLYVAITIGLKTRVATLRRAVTKNSVLSAADIVMKEADVSNLHQGYFTSINQVIGKHTKTTLRNGTRLSPRHLKNSLAVKKGSHVTIVASLGGIQVRMKGKALKSGAIGDWIKVENTSSSRKIDGKILQDGVVGVML